MTKETQLQYDYKQAFIMRLLSKGSLPLKSKEEIQQVLSKHLGEIDIVYYSEENIRICPLEYQTNNNQPLLIWDKSITSNLKNLQYALVSQMWRTKDAKAIFDETNYQTIVYDAFTDEMERHARITMWTHFANAMLELYSEVLGVYFDSSLNVFDSKQIINSQFPLFEHFQFFMTNIRVLAANDSGGMIVDTIGASIMGYPDVQCCFHSLQPNQVINKVFDVLYGIINEPDYLKDKETLDLNDEITWTFQYQEAIIHPERAVVEIYPGKYALNIK